MTRLRLRDPSLPPALTGWVVVDERGIPRFWATVWADVLKADIEDGTRAAHLAGIDRLYKTAETLPGGPALDDLLFAADYDGLETVLGSHLATLRNESVATGVDRAGAWASALAFVSGVLNHVSAHAGRKASDMVVRLARLEAMYSQLAPRPRKSTRPIRALPAEVVEDLYELFDPASPRNPFRHQAQRVRNQLLFLLLLHLGLRRGEALILPANALKDSVDPDTGLVRYWLNVVGTPEDDEKFDTRHAKPSIKTDASIRQLPVPETLVAAIEAYRSNYTRGASHPFLLNSQQNAPLAPQTVGDTFAAVTRALSARSKRLLADRRKRSVTPHDLRHTAAVARLARFTEAGFDLDTAVERLRVYFGWARSSDMPRLYARAYFETSMEDVWTERFDTFVDALRTLEGEAP